MYLCTFGAIKDAATRVLGARDSRRATTFRHLTARNSPATAAALWQPAAARITGATPRPRTAARRLPAAAGTRQLTAGNFRAAAAKAVTAAVTATQLLRIGATTAAWPLAPRATSSTATNT